MAPAPEPTCHIAAYDPASGAMAQVRQCAPVPAKVRVGLTTSNLHRFIFVHAT
jgi:hypothetical protein